ncbi:ribonuclease HII [Pseudaestuariivita sp.]|uniref:ribonuclease HII n=1 Tax=Pseudaestuariivita sp. TaxID=2211669 RepID=UPI0040596C1F
MDGPDFTLEEAAGARHGVIVAGVDEVGRGPLAGPVYAAAVVLDPALIPPGLDDSKKLTAAKRAALHDAICEMAVVSVASATVEEIDTLNILRASHLAMCRAVAGLPHMPRLALVDGNLLPADLPCAGQAVIKGDGLSLSIAAASIVAKFRRDCVMQDLAQHYPDYGWQTNMGYPSKSHRSALQKYGVTPYHRRSFKPVHNILYQDKNQSD